MIDGVTTTSALEVERKYDVGAEVAVPDLTGITASVADAAPSRANRVLS